MSEPLPGSPGSPRRVTDHALTQLTLLRLREFVREPEAVFWGLAFPIILSLGLGIAFRNQAPQPVRVAAADTDLAQSLRRETLLLVDELDPSAAADALRRGRVVLVAEADANGSVVYHYDDSNPDAHVARLLADAAIQRAAGRSDPVPIRNQLNREPGARYIDFLVPGLVGMGIMGNSIWGLGFSIVDARRRKLMKRIMATPMPRHYYLLSFFLWRLSFLAIEIGVPIGFGSLAFGVPVRGSLVDLTLVCLIGSLAFSALGLLVASRAKTIEAVSGLMNLVMMPMWILSGVFFSSERFPDAIQPLIRALPLTALIDGVRALMLRGEALAQVTPQLAVLGTWSIVCFAVAMRMFRWR